LATEFVEIISRETDVEEGRLTIFENWVSTKSVFPEVTVAGCGEGAGDTPGEAVVNVAKPAPMLLDGPIVDLLFAFLDAEREDTSRRRSSMGCAGSSVTAADDLSFLKIENMPFDDFSLSAIFVQDLGTKCEGLVGQVSKAGVSRSLSPARAGSLDQGSEVATGFYVVCGLFSSRHYFF
jgi:hypothetical protein